MVLLCMVFSNQFPADKALFIICHFFSKMQSLLFQADNAMLALGAVVVGGIVAEFCRRKKDK